MPLYLLTAVSMSSIHFDMDNRIAIVSDDSRVGAVSTYFLAAFAMLYAVGAALPKSLARGGRQEGAHPNGSVCFAFARVCRPSATALQSGQGKLWSLSGQASPSPLVTDELITGLYADEHHTTLGVSAEPCREFLIKSVDTFGGIFNQFQIAPTFSVSPGVAGFGPHLWGVCLSLGGEASQRHRPSEKTDDGSASAPASSPGDERCSFIPVRCTSTQTRPVTSLAQER